MSWEHKPGSRDAIVRGCVCPVSDNNHGEGRNGSYVTDGDCPLHGVREYRQEVPMALAYVIICTGFVLGGLLTWLLFVVL